MNKILVLQKFSNYRNLIIFLAIKIIYSEICKILKISSPNIYLKINLFFESRYLQTFFFPKLLMQSATIFIHNKNCIKYNIKKGKEIICTFLSLS